MKTVYDSFAEYIKSSPSTATEQDYFEAGFEAGEDKARFQIETLVNQRALLIKALENMTDVFLDTEGNHGLLEQDAMDFAYKAIYECKKDQ